MNHSYQPFQPILTKVGLRRFELFLEYVPACEKLHGIVHSYLQIGAAKATPYPVIPDGTQAVFIAPHGSFIGGAQSQARDIQILEPGDYFGIRFYPGALRHFFELNVAEITDQYADSHYFPCQEFAHLHDNIYSQPDFGQRAQLCEQWLLQHLKPRSAILFDQALSLIYQTVGSIKINPLAQKMGTSSRHLNRLFRQHTGLSTKTFAQIIRIQHACKQLFLDPSDSLQTANSLGYFDQAHFLNDYKKRLLTSPGMFFERFTSDFYNNKTPK